MGDIIHLSLFPNKECVVCGEEVEEGHLHCLECCNDYIEMCDEE